MTEDAPSAGDGHGQSPAKDQPDSLRWTSVVIVVMVLVLALINAASMRSWASTLPPTARNFIIYRAAQDWYDLTDRLGLAAPQQRLRAAWQSAHQWGIAQREASR